MKMEIMFYWITWQLDLLVETRGCGGEDAPVCCEQGCVQQFGAELFVTLS